MSELSKNKMGTDGRPNVLPIKPASGPGFLGPNYSPADEMLPPAAVGVRRGGDLGDVIGAVKGVIYYGDMMGFGEASSSFTRGMPGLKPLGVNYFMNTGLQCSNGATMWEYVNTIPTGGALGQKVKNAIKGVGLPQLRGMAPGIMEDAQAALNPFPVINAVVGSGFPQCRLMRLPVGDATGKIQNVDGNLLVDPSGILISGGRYYQEHWIQDRKVPPVRRDNESTGDQYLRGDPIQLDYDDWNKAPKTHREDGCLVDPKGAPKDTIQPSFCTKTNGGGNITTLGDGTQVMVYNLDASSKAGTLDFFQDYKRRVLVKSPHAVVSLSVAAISIMALLAFWSAKGSLRK
jgi:hypothetical protein